jgi:hypothetical protein
MAEPDNRVIVDVILRAIETGAKAEDEAVEECGDLAKTSSICGTKTSRCTTRSWNGPGNTHADYDA